MRIEINGLGLDGSLMSIFRVLRIGNFYFYFFEFVCFNETGMKRETGLGFLSISVSCLYTSPT